MTPPLTAAPAGHSRTTTAHRQASVYGQQRRRLCLSACGRTAARHFCPPTSVAAFTPSPVGVSVGDQRQTVRQFAAGWLSRDRRMSKEYERKVQTSETLIELAMIRLLVARLGGRTS